MTETNFLIDNWMSNVKTKNDSIRKASNAEGKNLLAGHEEVKSGLGFMRITNTNKISVKNNSDYSAFANGKQVLKKRKAIDITEKDMDFDQVHGLVDDNLGVISRTDISSSKLPVSKRKVPVAATESKVEGPIQNKLELPRPSVPVEIADEKVMKKKRTKTRSKQKNIRKDRRADHVKPPHLQVGSALYSGRPMTEATKIALNVPVKAKESQKKGSQRNNREEND